MENRNQQIHAAYCAGERTQAIADRFGLTKQRIIQIAKSNGAPSRIYEPTDREIGWMTCKVDGCKTVARSKWGTLCNKHYFRCRRTGTTADREIAGYSETSNGYMARNCKGHPAASPSGLVYEHRAVFLDHNGKDGHKCFWCGTQLSWGGCGQGKLHVDHLDGEKHHNEPKNLVASCHRCNVNRGLFMSWLSKHSDDPVIKAIFDQKAKSSSEDCNLGKSNKDDTDWR